MADEPQAGRCAAVREQASALAHHDRGDHEPQRVYQPGGQEGLGQLGAAVDLQFPAGLPLQFGDLDGDVAGQDRGRLPLGLVRPWEATYFGRPFKMPANGWSVIFGQSRAKFW